MWLRTLERTVKGDGNHLSILKINESCKNKNADDFCFKFIDNNFVEKHICKVCIQKVTCYDQVSP